jgi:drug/metabolite transporter (DMT)-like permease
MNMNKYKVLTGVAMLLIAAIGWGGMFPVAKATLSVIDAFYLASIRYAAMAAVFVVFLAQTEGRAALGFDNQAWRLGALGATGFGGFGMLAVYGLGHSRPEHGAIIMATQPLIATLVIWVTRGTRPSAATLSTILVALAGVLLVITRGHLAEIFGGGTGYGDMMLFIGAVSWVVYTLGASNFAGWSPLRYTTLTCLLALPAIFAVTVVATMAGLGHVPDPAAISPVVVWQMVYIVAIASVLCVLAWNIGNKTLGPATGMLFINFIPITTFAIEIAQGHHFERIELVGAAMVICALVANTLMFRAATRAAAPAARHQAAAPRPLCEITN